MKSLAMFLGFSCVQPAYAHARAIENQLVHRTAGRLADEGLGRIPYVARVITRDRSYIVRFSNANGRCFYSAHYDLATLKLQSAHVNFAATQANDDSPVPLGRG